MSCFCLLPAAPYNVTAVSELFVLDASGPTLEYVSGLAVAASGDIWLSAGLGDCSPHLYSINRSTTLDLLHHTSAKGARTA